LSFATCDCEVDPSGDTSGVTDADNLQNCINDFNSSGGHVILTSGTYYVNRTIHLQSNVTVRGDGSQNTILRWVLPVGSKEPVFTNKNPSVYGQIHHVMLKDFKINGQNHWVIGVLFDGGARSNNRQIEQVTVRDMEIVNCGEYGIHTKQVDGVFIRDISLNHNGHYSGDASRHEENHNIYVRDSKRVFIERVTTTDSSGNGINVSGKSKNVLMSIVTANDNQQNGIRVADSEYVKITESTANYNGNGNHNGSDTCLVGDDLCSGFELRVEDDGQSGNYDGVEKVCIQNSTANFNHNYWLYIDSAHEYKLTNNSKQGNLLGDQASISSNSTVRSDACSLTPRNIASWPFSRSEPDPGTNSTCSSTGGGPGTGSGTGSGGGVDTEVLLSTIHMLLLTPDNDGDGFLTDDDCDDEDELIYPGADEICDGIDNDCDGVIDPNCSQVPWQIDSVNNMGFHQPRCLLC
jgi:hypothetical protein